MKIYYILVNLLTFILFFIDKEKAKRNMWRTKESILLSFIIIGGFVGGILGMYVFRHKTKKLYFKIVALLFLLVHFYLIINKSLHF